MDKPTRDYIATHGDECACVPIMTRQVVWYCVLLVAALVFLVKRWDYFLALFTFVTAAFYLSIILFRLVAVTITARGGGPIQISDADLAALDDAGLPVFTVLVPLYHEANVADHIIAALSKMDYPADKLDVKLLLEGDDDETRAALDATDLPAWAEIIVVPDSQPKTKPKACNHGLAPARGEYLVIYDAEDRPDPDQLRKVVVAFRQAAPEVACVQAALNYYNPRQNILTRWFTIEYTAWFDLFLPGLERMNVPIPLGGTSNHFRMEVIQELGGWDPFNVTEDCDLGIRLYKTGRRTILINTTTWEEANSQLGNWIRQRSRWIKGYFQTHLVHFRRPLTTFRQMGIRGVFGFVMSVGGMSLMLVMNLVFWLVGLGYLICIGIDVSNGNSVWSVIAGEREAFRTLPWKMIYWGPEEDVFWSTMSVIFFVVTCVLILANLLFIIINVMACRQRRYGDLVLVALLSPIYWVLISIAAWKGLIQLFTNPFHWEKTRHGLDDPGE